MEFKQKTPAVWTEGDYFKVSDKGAIAPCGPYEGRISYLNIETAEHILNNMDSFRKTVMDAKSKAGQRELSRELSGLVAKLVAVGLDQDVAIQQAQEILKKRVA